MADGFMKDVAGVVGSIAPAVPPSIAQEIMRSHLGESLIDASLVERITTGMGAVLDGVGSGDGAAQASAGTELTVEAALDGEAAVDGEVVDAYGEPGDGAEQVDSAEPIAGEDSSVTAGE